MKIMIAIPCMAKIDTPFVQSLLNLAASGVPGAQVQVQFSEGSLIYDSRNQIANIAIEKEFDRVFWIDSDMVFEPDILKRMSTRMDEGVEYVSALAFRRLPPHLPVIYQEIGFKKSEDGHDVPTLTPYEFYPENSFFEIAGSGFGCVMTSVQLLKDCRDTFGLPFSPRLGFGEDITFCLECQELGRKMYCDSSIKIGHLSRITVDENIYKEVRDAKVQHNHSGT